MLTDKTRDLESFDSYPIFLYDIYNRPSGLFWHKEYHKMTEYIIR